MRKGKRAKRVIGDSDDTSKQSIESGAGEADEDESEAESGADDGEGEEEDDEEEDDDDSDGEEEDDDDDDDDNEGLVDEEDQEGITTRGGASKSAVSARIRRAAVQSKQQQVTLTRDVPTRRAATASTSRTARAQRIVEDEDENDEIEDEDELDDSLSDAGSELQTTPNSSRSKRITLRLPSSANGKGKSAGTTTARKRGRPLTKSIGKRGKLAKRGGGGRAALPDESEDEEVMEQDASSEDFENANTFASLPKTARQLAKERAAQGLGSPEESDIPDAAEDGLGGDDGVKKQQMTESELALKRSEMARRRRNQTEKKLEDDKIETINRLLKKQVSRRNTRAAADGDESDGDNDEDGDGGVANGAEKRSSAHLTPLQRKQRPQPFFRYIQSAHGSSLSLPAEEVASGAYTQKWNSIFNLKDEATAQ